MKAKSASRGSTSTSASSGTKFGATGASGRWVDLGTLRGNEDKSYIVVRDNVEIFVDGEKVDLGKFRTVKLIDPRVGLETALSNGKLSQEDYTDRLDYFNDKNILFKLTIPPKSDN